MKRQRCDELLKSLNAAVKAWADEQNVDVKFGTATYEMVADSMGVRITVDERSGVTREAATFLDRAKWDRDVDEAWLNSEVVIGGLRYTFLGIRPKARKRDALLLDHRTGKQVVGPSKSVFDRLRSQCGEGGA